MSSGDARSNANWRSALAHFVYDVRWVLIAFVASRAIIFGVILLSRLIMVRSTIWHPGGLLSVLDQFDGELWYMGIARHGYFFSTVDPSPMPFFPFFPLLLWLTSFVFHDLRIAAFIVPHVSLLVAGVLLHRIVQRDYDDPWISRAAVVFFMFNPAANFFSSAYTESTFVMLAIGSFLAALKGRWVLACVLGMCLSATRNVGVLIVAPLFIEHCRQMWARRGQVSDLFHPRVLLLGIVPLGLGAYMLFSYVKFGDPLAFVNASKVWGRTLTSPAQTFASLTTYEPLYQWIFLGTMAAGLVLLPLGAFLRIRLSYLVWSALLTATYLCASSMEAWPRFLSVEFPLYIILGVLTARLRWMYEPLVTGSIGILVICTVLSANGYWWT